MNHIMKKLSGPLILFLFLASFAYGAPKVINYAGQVAVNGQPFTGTGLFKFALVNSDGNETMWSNDGQSVAGSEPDANVSVPVHGGLYSILLGNTEIPGMEPLEPSTFWINSALYLRVWFSDGVNGFQQLIPDRPLASVPYALTANLSFWAQSVFVPYR